MSRAERRQYQRMMKGQDPNAPRTPPGSTKPPRRRSANEPRDWSFTRRFWVRSTLVAAAVGVIGLSVAWPSGADRALMIGAALTAGTPRRPVLVRWYLKRSAERSARPAPRPLTVGG
jgi:uncharacterized membrane protein YccC